MNKIDKKGILILLIILIILVPVIFFWRADKSKSTLGNKIDNNVPTSTFSGKYVCLPLIKDDKSGDCQFGALSDSGDYYAVNFGQAPENLKAFNAGEYFKAEGFVVLKEELSSSYWQKFNMKGIFTITKGGNNANVSGKVDINAICEQALSYMTFPDSKSAEGFLDGCKKGDNPEVIEDYLKRIGKGDNVAI